MKSLKDTFDEYLKVVSDRGQGQFEVWGGLKRLRDRSSYRDFAEITRDVGERAGERVGLVRGNERLSAENEVFSDKYECWMIFGGGNYKYSYKKDSGEFFLLGFVEPKKRAKEAIIFDMGEGLKRIPLVADITCKWVLKYIN